MDKIKKTYKNAKTQSGEYVSDLKKGAKVKSSKDIMLELAGMEDGVDAFWEKLQMNLQIYMGIFGLACLVCFVILSAATFLYGIIGMAKGGCIMEGDIGLSNAPQMIKPFYDSVLGWFFGDNNQVGMVKIMRDGILKNQSFQFAKILCIIVSIIFLGVGYIMGTVEMKTKDLIILCIKLSCISFFTDPKSIYFLDKYIVSVFLSSMDYVTALGQGIVLKAVLKNISGLPRDLIGIIDGTINNGSFSVISLIDRIFGVMFSDPFFKKVLAMFTYNFLMIPIIVITFGIMLSFLGAMVKVIMYLLYLRIAIGISFSMMPLFLCLLLFENTKKIAHNYFEDGLIEPAFNYFFNVLFVSMFCFVALGYLSKAFYFQACQEWLNIRSLISDPMSMISLIFIIFIFPPIIMFLIVPMPVAIHFNMATYVQNIFLFFVSTIVISYNLDAIQSMADKLSNAFNFNPNNRKKDNDGATPFGKGAAKFSGAMTAPFTRDNIMGKFSKDKDGKPVVKGGLLKATDAMFKTNLASKVHGNQGIEKNLFKLSKDAFGKIANSYQNIQPNQNRDTKIKSAISPILAFLGSRGKLDFGSSGSTDVKSIRQEMFGSKKDAYNAMRHLDRITKNIKEENPKMSDREIQVQAKKQFIKDYKDSTISKEEAIKRFEFLSFDYKQDKNKNESSKFDNLMEDYFGAKGTKNLDKDSAMKKAKEEFMNSNNNNPSAAKYFDERALDYKKSKAYNDFVELKIMDGKDVLLNDMSNLQDTIKDMKSKNEEEKPEMKKDKEVEKEKDEEIKAQFDIKSGMKDLENLYAEIKKHKDLIDNEDELERALREKEIRIKEMSRLNEEEKAREIKLLQEQYEFQVKDAQQHLDNAIEKTLYLQVDEIKLKLENGNINNEKSEMQKQAEEIIQQQEKYKESIEKLHKIEEEANKIIAEKQATNSSANSSKFSTN